MEIFQKIGVRSVLALPMNTANLYIGFAMIHSTRSWNPEEVVQLQLIADLVANTRQRINAEMALRYHALNLEKRVAQRTKDLADVNRHLSLMNRHKDEFLANMSHELRTPLNSILLKVELLKEGVQGPITKQQHHSLDVVRESSNHLLNMLADMLDLSTSAVEMPSLDLSVVSLQEVCQISMNFIQRLADTRAVRIAHNWPEADILVHADVKRLEQILIHLLSNAVKFTPTGGDIGIDMAIDPENNTLQLTVWDRGQGISEDDLPLLFHPFVQLEGGLNRKYEGAGIGLALVKRLAMLHGWQISVKSKIGVGSRFIITLPYQVAEITNLPRGHY
jgi:signal transduction histidine kinase